MQIINTIKKYLFKYHRTLPMDDPMLCYVSDYVFLATLQTLLLSLRSASFLSHSNLKIEMSLLGSMDVIACKFWPL